MKITILGTGYVGLVTGACLADFGMSVVCADIDEGKIQKLQQGIIPIYEPGLDRLVEKNTAQKRLTFTTNVEGAIREGEVVFIAVGTPAKPDGSADLTYVEKVVRTIGRNLNGYKVIVTKSTVPIGTGSKVKQWIQEENPQAHFSVVSNPEFLREGSAIQDFIEPDRIVIGAEDEQAIQVMKEVYKPLYHLEIPFVITDIESAEMIKYASNGFLATKISFINEIAVLCERVGGNVLDVARGMGLDHRIGPKFLQPGPGFGGSCFPKDSQAIVQVAREYGYRFQIMEAVLSVNQDIKRRMIQKVLKALPKGACKVAILGLAFKPETDDIRESPAIPLLQALLDQGLTPRVFDPAAMENMQALYPTLEYTQDPYACCEGADMVVLVTEWNQFRHLDLHRLKNLLRYPIMVDLRNIYTPQVVKTLGFTYVGVGRGKDV